MKYFAITFLIVMSAARVALAEGVFFVERANWSVFNIPDYCVATNRPTLETNYSPYMTFNLLHDLQQDEVHAAAYFWPNAFEKGQNVQLELKALSGPDALAVPASARDDYAVRTDRGLTKKELRVLRDANAILVIAGGSPHQMAVQMAPDLRDILLLLENCAQLVGRG